VKDYSLSVAIFFLLFFFYFPALSQKQLVLLRKENVLLRLYPGDDIVLRLKDGKTIIRSYVNNLSDTAVVTHNDTIPFHHIERLYFPQTKFYNRIGYGLVVGGVGYFLIDQLNVVLVSHESPRLNDKVTNVSISALAVGLPLMLIKKKSQKLGYKYRLMMVKRGSLFYKEDTRQVIYPYGEN
jgi:hypothetical protein